MKNMKIIKLTSLGCGMCKIQKPMWDKIAEKHNLEIEENDIDTDMGIKQTEYFNVQSLPFVVLIDKDDTGDIIVKEFRGAQNEEATIEFFDSIF